MKKLIVLAGLVLGFSFITMTLTAQTASPDKSANAQSQQSSAGAKGTFVDNNKDGVCDHHQATGKGDGCTKFVDKDGDGKCDTCLGKGNCVKGNGCKGNAKAGCCPKSCQGNGNHHGNGSGSCGQGAGKTDKK